MDDPELHGRDQAFYARATDYFAPQNKGWLDNHFQVLGLYIRPVLSSLNAIYKEKQGKVRFVELGAGTCLTSLMLKRHFPESDFTCVDISLRRMQQLIDKGAATVGVDHCDVNLVECDFSSKLPFDDQQFDVVVFDASLHHSRNIWFTLEECARILTSNGTVVALREQYLAPLTARYALDRLLRTPEVQFGVSENAYLKEQYDYYFKAAHFETTFFAVSPGKWRLFSFLNGYAFSKWSILATKKA